MTFPRRATILAAGALLAMSIAAGGAYGARAAPPPQAARLNVGQFNYVLSCGGCHGLTGEAEKSGIPTLRGRAGAFLCSREGREYVIRLPNVAFADMDDASLAEVMNYVMFGLGRESIPADAAPYSAAEVAGLRQAPLKNRDLLSMARELRAEAAMRCGAYPHG